MSLIPLFSAFAGSFGCAALCLGRPYNASIRSFADVTIRVIGPRFVGSAYSSFMEPSSLSSLHVFMGICHIEQTVKQATLLHFLFYLRSGHFSQRVEGKRPQHRT